MTILGIDDTDSREHGMCTTYVAFQIAQQLQDESAKLMLIRLNPGVIHKTRGNAAIAISTTCNTTTTFETAVDIINELAELSDPNTQPGLVVAPSTFDDVPQTVSEFSLNAIRSFHEKETAVDLIEENGYLSSSWNGGRGLIGALAAIGANNALDEWTYECLTYRDKNLWGTERNVDSNSIFEVSNQLYPSVWDSFDKNENYPVCVPRTPCPVLHGIRGETPDAVEEMAKKIKSETPAHRVLFITNQGTDAHIQPGTIGSLEDGHSYSVDGVVSSKPYTIEGGHVFFKLKGTSKEILCSAFEPTKQFRNYVRNLDCGDKLTVYGEVTHGTLKLEKFAVRNLVTTKTENPLCAICNDRMKSSGRSQGYRCRKCGTKSSHKIQTPYFRDITLGWYEVPPCARRHLAKPLIRGGFDSILHPEI